MTLDAKRQLVSKLVQKFGKFFLFKIIKKLLEKHFEPKSETTQLVLYIRDSMMKIYRHIWQEDAKRKENAAWLLLFVLAAAIGHHYSDFGDSLKLYVGSLVFKLIRIASKDGKDKQLYYFASVLDDFFKWDSLILLFNKAFDLPAQISGLIILSLIIYVFTKNAHSLKPAN